MEMFSAVNFAPSNSRPVDEGAVEPIDIEVDPISPYTSRSTSPADTCPSPTSSISSSVAITTVAELADQLGRSTFRSARIPNQYATGPRRAPPSDRRRTDHLAPSYLDAVHSRRQTYGRPQHSTGRLASLGSLVERLMHADFYPSDTRAASIDLPTRPSMSSSSFDAGSSQSTPECDIPISPGADENMVDPMQLIDATIQGLVRTRCLTKPTQRRPGAVRKEVRMRKRAKFRPR